MCEKMRKHQESPRDSLRRVFVAKLVLVQEDQNGPALDYVDRTRKIVLRRTICKVVEGCESKLSEWAAFRSLPAHSNSMYSADFPP